MCVADFQFSPGVGFSPPKRGVYHFLTTRVGGSARPGSRTTRSLFRSPRPIARAEIGQARRSQRDLDPALLTNPLDVCPVGKDNARQLSVLVVTGMRRAWAQLTFSLAPLSAHQIIDLLGRWRLGRPSRLVLVPLAGAP